MNNDYLRVNSKTEDEDIVVSEFKNDSEVVEEEKEKPINLITLLNFSRNGGGSLDLKNGNLPNLRGVLAVLLICAISVVVFSFISFLTYDPTVLLFTAMLASLIFPVFLVVFFFKFNASSRTTFVEIILGSIIGACLFVVLNYIEWHVNGLIYFKWLQIILDVILRDAFLFVCASLFVKIAKKDNLFDAILLAVAVYAGYVFVNSLDELVKSLFTSVELIGGTSAGAIILTEDGFKTIFDSFLQTLLYDVIFSSITLGCYAIVNGGVIGLNVSPVKDEKYSGWSLYMLFFITLVLHLGAIFPSAIPLFEILLKGLSLIFSIILAIMILNYYLSKIHVTKISDEK